MGKRKVLEADTNVVGNVLSCNNPELGDWFKRNYIYVDKSLFIKEFIHIDGNALFTRPRRFGKTLNMMLLQQFLSFFEEEPDERFKALKIFQDVDFVNAHHRRYPVFLVSFVSAGSGDWRLIDNKIKLCILKSVEPLKCYLRTVKVGDDPVKREPYQEMVVLLEKMRDKSNDAGDLASYFERIVQLTTTYFGIKPIVLIDEYDAPIRGANEGGFLDRALGIFKSFYSGLSKSSSVKLCFMGILRAAASTVLSDLNHLLVCDINASDWAADRFSGMFGFTREEVEELVQKCHENGLSVPTMEELENHYGDYVFGESTHIFNPYSVMHVLFNRKIGNYWTTSGSAGNILKFLRNYDSKLDLAKLLKLTSPDPGNIECLINDASDIVYGEASSSPATFHTILYHCVYLTRATKETHAKEPAVGPLSSSRKIMLKIPNLEVDENLKSDIFGFFFKSTDMQKFTNLFIRGLEDDNFQEALEFIVRNAIFALDAKTFPKDERERNYPMAFALFFGYFYHGNGGMEEHRHFYEQNTGAGIADLIVEVPITNEGEVLGVIFEFKYAQKEQEMEKRALEGLNQIVKNNYLNHFLKTRAASRVLLVGLSCHRLEIVFCYQLATRLPPSSSFVLDPSGTKYCFFPLELESRASNAQMQT